MSADNYPSIFSPQMEAIVYITSSQRNGKIPQDRRITQKTKVKHLKCY